MARESKSADARQRTLARELEWVRMGARARQAKGKARLSAYERLLAEANDAKDTTRELEIAIPPGPRLGDTVIEVRNLRKGYGDRLLIEDLTFSLPRSGIIGIIGPNGAGKTTLFRMIVGQEPPDGGTVEIGETVKLSYVDQGRDELRAGPDGLRRRSPTASRRSRSATARSRRAPTSRASTSAAPISRSSSGTCPAASGTASTWPSCSRPGATSCSSTSRPTTSTSTRCGRSRPASSRFPGCVVVISHDRWFLDRIATHILAFESDSQVRFFEGNVSDYEAFRHAELGTAADQPHRIRYKRLAG